MSEELDGNKIAAEFITQNIDHMWDTLKNYGKLIIEKITFSSHLRNYITKTYERNSKARSFLQREAAVNIYSFYVPIGVKSGQATIYRVNTTDLFHNGPFVVIVGSAGCGKSILTRHLFLDALIKKKKIPILIELRDLNEEPVDLNEMIAKALARGGLVLESDSIRAALEHGMFALFFDGFDELQSKLRNKCAMSIHSFSNTNKNNWVLVTSRPDNMFLGWNEFRTYQTIPLNLDQAVELIKKTPTLEEIKDRFIKELKKRLFRKHHSFLSNPLLLSIMLLTYRDSSNIPSKLSVFYMQAYEALFQRHDAWKGSGFQRQLKTELDIHDFSRLFSTFSIFAYENRLLTFSRSNALKMIKDARDFTRINVDCDAFLSDATQAVCLLAEDGLELMYSHRSFQEYFVALFISEAAPNVKNSLIRNLKNCLRMDAVLNLLHEMQPEFVESEFILLELKELFLKIKMSRRSVSKSTHLRYVRLLSDRIFFSNTDDYFTNQTITFDIVFFALKHCRYLLHNDESRSNVKQDSLGIQNKMLYASQAKIVSTSDLSISDPEAAALFKSNDPLGSNTLLELWDIAREIERRGQINKNVFSDAMNRSRRSLNL